MNVRVCNYRENQCSLGFAVLIFVKFSALLVRKK